MSNTDCVFKAFSWLISFRSPLEVWKNPGLAFAEFPILHGIWIIREDFKAKNEATVYQSITASVTCMIIELFLLFDIYTWYYEHGTISFFGGNIPLYLIFLYFYAFNCAFTFAKALSLPKFPEALLTGLMTLLTLLEQETAAVHAGVWTYHKNDPTVINRYFGVPWVEILGIAGIAICTTLTADHFISPNQKTSVLVKSISKACIVNVAVILGTHFLVHQLLCFLLLENSVTAMIICTLFLVFIFSMAKPNWWTSRCTNTGYSPKKEALFKLRIVLFFVVIYFGSWMRPENFRLYGPHQALGPCDTMEYEINQFLLPVVRNKYVCLTGNDPIRLWDFNCLTNEELILLSNTTTKWYPTCGKPVQNRALLMFNVISSGSIFLILAYFCTYKISLKIAANGQAMKEKHM